MSINILVCRMKDRHEHPEIPMGIVISREIDIRGSRGMSPKNYPAGCCQTNEPKHQDSFDAYFYEVTKERHSVRAASRFSLKVLRVESDLCELNRL